MSFFLFSCFSEQVVGVPFASSCSFCFSRSQRKRFVLFLCFSAHARACSSNAHTILSARHYNSIIV